MASKSATTPTNIARGFVLNVVLRFSLVTREFTLRRLDLYTGGGILGSRTVPPQPTKGGTPPRGPVHIVYNGATRIRRYGIG